MQLEILRHTVATHRRRTLVVEPWSQNSCIGPTFSNLSTGYCIEIWWLQTLVINSIMPSTCSMCRPRGLIPSVNKKRQRTASRLLCINQIQREPANEEEFRDSLKYARGPDNIIRVQKENKQFACWKFWKSNLCHTHNVKGA